MKCSRCRKEKPQSEFLSEAGELRKNCSSCRAGIERWRSKRLGSNRKPKPVDITPLSAHYECHVRMGEAKAVCDKFLRGGMV